MKDLLRKFSFMATVMAIMMTGFTFAACSSDDDDSGNGNYGELEDVGLFTVEDKYECTDLNYGYWYRNANGTICLEFLNFNATSLSNIPKNIHAVAIELPIKELAEGVYTCDFDFDANANSEGGCSLFSYDNTVTIAKDNNKWLVTVAGINGIYQTYDPDTYSENEKFTFLYSGNIEYNKLFEEE